MFPETGGQPARRGLVQTTGAVVTGRGRGDGGQTVARDAPGFELVHTGRGVAGCASECAEEGGGGVETTRRGAERIAEIAEAVAGRRHDRDRHGRVLRGVFEGEVPERPATHRGPPAVGVVRDTIPGRGRVSQSVGVADESGGRRCVVGEDGGFGVCPAQHGASGEGAGVADGVCDRAGRRDVSAGAVARQPGGRGGRTPVVLRGGDAGAR